MEDLVTNRKALYQYEILETLEAGIALLGTEIKSLRQHGGNIQDAYVIVKPQGAYLKNSSIAPYKQGNIFNHEERRDRQLLLHKREIKRLIQQTEEKGRTVIALSLYLKRGFVKVKIAVARGKKTHDKRASIKERDEKKWEEQHQ